MTSPSPRNQLALDIKKLIPSYEAVKARPRPEALLILNALTYALPRVQTTDPRWVANRQLVNKAIIDEFRTGLIRLGQAVQLGALQAKEIPAAVANAITAQRRISDEKARAVGTLVLCAHLEHRGIENTSSYLKQEQVSASALLMPKRPQKLEDVDKAIHRREAATALLRELAIASDAEFPARLNEFCNFPSHQQFAIEHNPSDAHIAWKRIQRAGFENSLKHKSAILLDFRNVERQVQKAKTTIEQLLSEPAGRSRVPRLQQLSANHAATEAALRDMNPNDARQVREMLSGQHRSIAPTIGFS